ncbi:restriction endonuclease [Anaerolineales bacterium HSG6]|nr:restriction endonuclease [Anaerolineales bacterium HSG6]
MTKRKTSPAKKLTPQEKKKKADQYNKKLRAQGKAELKRISRLSKTRALAQLKAMDPIVFEYLTAALFERKGYKTHLTVTSGDEGVDVLATKNFRKTVIQCKRYGGSVGQPTIRDLYGTMQHNKAADAYLVTTATVTKQAQEWAKGKPIHLVDGYILVNWVTEGPNKSNRVWYWIGGAILLAMGLVGISLLMSSGLPFFSSETETEVTATIAPTEKPMPTETTIPIETPPVTATSVPATATAKPTTATPKPVNEGSEGQPVEEGGGSIDEGIKQTPTQRGLTPVDEGGSVR